MSEQYTYAVARIRALEVSLFSNSTLDPLIACQNYEPVSYTHLEVYKRQAIFRHP